MPDLFGITELLPKHTHRKVGFMVRLGWKDNAPQIVKSFNFDDYDNRQDALDHALVYRNTQLTVLKEAGVWPMVRVYTKSHSNNTSGVLGVSKSKQWSHGKPADIFVWRAQWVDPVTKCACSAKFSERKWGPEIAFNMVCACREAKENLFINIR